MATLNTILSQNPVFSSMDNNDRQFAGTRATSRNYTRGESIVFSGDIWPYIFVVAEGSINVQKMSAEGRSLVVTTLTPGDLFWGLAFFQENLSMPVTLEAQSQAVIYLWSRQQLLPVLLRNGASVFALCQLMVVRMLRASEIVEELAFQPLTSRLARLLLNQFPVDQDSAARYLTLNEMAERIGTTREMVCRILYRFAEEGAIQINRTEFVFTNRRILKKYIGIHGEK